jgi:hypothetical protein
MTTLELKTKAESISENERSTIASITKDLLKSDFDEVGRVDTDGFEGSQFQDGISFIYKLDDGFVIVIDTDEEDFIYYEKEMDNAMKTATDKLYEHTFNR